MKIQLLAFVCLMSTVAVAQELPIQMTLAEKKALPNYLLERNIIRGVDPPTVPVRAAAQFEEMQGVAISWKSTDYLLLSQIIDYAQDVATVYIFCSDSNSVKTYLNSHSVPLTNLVYLQTATNTIWARDFGANTIYENEVSNLSLTDWSYNRPRPLDDASPTLLATKLGIPLYETTQAPNYLVHTGGNYMSDGHGTAFSSKLVLDENATGGGWSNNLNESDVDSIMKRYMGITRYIKMETLPYDGIHHIDMHMKLLDEETLLMGEYPTGVADGPQIEQNLQYVTANFLNCYNRPYKVIRMPQPPDQYNNNHYPNTDGSYLTYTNALILNNLILVPSYYTQYDTTAQRIWHEAMPGYDIHFLNCNNIIPSSGAIHCITHEIGVSDPIFISHAKLLDTYQSTGTYTVDAYVNTSSGVSGATMHWTIDTTTGYSPVSMTSLGGGNYEAMIPAQVAGTKVFYYLEANSNSGRTVRKPLVAPAGVFMFKVLTTVSTNDVVSDIELFQPYPVPANENLNVSFYLKNQSDIQLTLTDVMGRVLQTIVLNNLESGVHQYDYNVTNLPTGNYMIRMNDQNGRSVVKQISVAR